MQQATVIYIAIWQGYNQCSHSIVHSVESFQTSLVSSTIPLQSSVWISNKHLAIFISKNGTHWKHNKSSWYPLQLLHLLAPNADVDTNACNKEICTVLLQTQPDRLPKPLEYWSRYLTQAKQSNSTTESKTLLITLDSETSWRNSIASRIATTTLPGRIWRCPSPGSTTSSSPSPSATQNCWLWTSTSG